MSKQKFDVGEKVIVKANGLEGTIKAIKSRNQRKWYSVYISSKDEIDCFYSYELYKAPELSKFKEGDRVILTKVATDWLKENDIYKQVDDYLAVYVIDVITKSNGKYAYRIKNEKTGYVIYGIYFLDEDLALYVEKPTEKEQETGNIVKIETTLGDIVTNDPDLIQKLFGDNDRITFHEEIHPGHAVINPGGAISCVEDLGVGKTNQKDTPKKDKPIQLVEFREQDVVDKRAETEARIAEWKDICNVYLEGFCNKHEWTYEPDMWVSNDPGTVVLIGDMYVSMDDIRYDIDHDIPKDYFTKWYWKRLEISELTDYADHYMNYESFCKGAPDYWTEERIQSIRVSKKRIEDAKAELEKEIENTRKGKLF